MSKKILSIAIPCLNEENNISLLIEKIVSLPKLNDYQYEILVIDDGSTDSTWEKLKSLKKIYPQLRAIKLSRNFGKEITLICAVKNINNNSHALITLDSDMQHPPAFIEDLILEYEKEEFSIIEGIKSDRGKETLFYKLFAQFFYSLANKFSNFDLKSSSDFKILNQNVIDALRQMNEKNFFFRGVLAWTGFKVKQIPFEVNKRNYGHPTMSIRKKILFSLNALTSLSGRPLFLVFLLGFLFFIISIILTSVSLYMKLINQPPPGYTTVVILILFTGSCLFFSLGIIGEYLAKIYIENKDRPQFLIEEQI